MHVVVVIARCTENTARRRTLDYRVIGAVFNEEKIRLLNLRIAHDSGGEPFRRVADLTVVMAIIYRHLLARIAQNASVTGSSSAVNKTKARTERNAYFLHPVNTVLLVEV